MTKAGNGEGSLRRLPSGLWSWRISVYVKGKRTRIGSSEKTKTAAAAAR